MKKILIVDELSTLSKVYIDLLSRHYQSEAGTSAYEIIPRAERLDPDLVIVNSELPGFDPHEFCQSIKNDLKVPVLLLLDAGSPTSLQIDGCSADEVITKPFTKELFFEKIAGLFIKTPG